MKKETLYVAFSTQKGRGRQNNVHRLGGKLPILPERL